MFVRILIVGQPGCFHFPPPSDVLVWVTVPDRVRLVPERAALADPADEADAKGAGSLA